MPCAAPVGSGATATGGGGLAHAARARIGNISTRFLIVIVFPLLASIGRVLQYQKPRAARHTARH
jgi:hypothetical protein